MVQAAGVQAATGVLTLQLQTISKPPVHTAQEAANLAVEGVILRVRIAAAILQVQTVVTIQPVRAEAVTHQVQEVVQVAQVAQVAPDVVQKVLVVEAEVPEDVAEFKM